MAAVALSGDDTLQINNRILNDTADGMVIEITFPNEGASVKTGKNGNAIFGYNAQGEIADVKLRLIRASSDDKFMNQLYNLQKKSFSTFPTMIGVFTKSIGDGGDAKAATTGNPGGTAGKLLTDNYVLSGGVFMKGIETKNNVDGDSEQSVSIYTMRFASCTRQIS